MVILHYCQNYDIVKNSKEFKINGSIPFPIFNNMKSTTDKKKEKLIAKEERTAPIC